MPKTIIVSNRLPVQINITGNQVSTKASVGGLATGMKSVHRDGNGLWVGWSGITEEELDPTLEKQVEDALQNHQCKAVSLTKYEVDHYYYGFSNRALWPMFHYFMEYTEFDNKDWEAYKKVNQKFADVVIESLEEGDQLWVHDYQLLLVPKLVRDQRPDIKIGFFLHIPFPSFEILRTFPVRESLLEGMLGADLVGFHTYNYERHFISSVKRLLLNEVTFNEIQHGDRVVSVGSYPMGIDYDKFQNQAQKKSDLLDEDRTDLQKKINSRIHENGESKLILSIDRLDYTKGIANRVKAFEYFLEKYPDYRKKVELIMLAVPSRANVPQYQKLKREIDELVGRINGKYSTVDWTPVHYFYRSMPFSNLIDLYTTAHIALVTPVRDGMNLVAKEYVATRTDQSGVLILSEMAGASHELNEALLINPNNYEEVADTILQAINMPIKEQQKRMKFMQKRIKRYDVVKWAEEFMTALGNATQKEDTIQAAKMNQQRINKMLADYRKSSHRLFFLDYDGTLSGFYNNPQDARPEERIYRLLDLLSSSQKNEVVVISGRDKKTFTKWFPNKPYHLITDHGVWLKEINKDWREFETVSTEWKVKIYPILERFVDRTPGTFIEQKEFSLAWHYRKTDPELAQRRLGELESVLGGLITNNNLSILKGNKVLEIKNSNVNKGRAVSNFINEHEHKFDFMFCIGDDVTDEFMFEALPDEAYTVKVGLKKTAANYRIKGVTEVYELLKQFVDQS